MYRSLVDVVGYRAPLSPVSCSPLCPPPPSTEFPSNPLLQVPDLKHLVELGRRYSFPVVVDDTVGNVHNLNLTGGSHGADVVVSSLTKLFSGKGAFRRKCGSEREKKTRVLGSVQEGHEELSVRAVYQPPSPLPSLVCTCDVWGSLFPHASLLPLCVCMSR